MSESTTSTTNLPPGSTFLRRTVLVVVSVFAAWQIFATFLWIAPASGLRQIVPGNLLHEYMIPMQGQSWSVFAPEPINGEYRLQVRAEVTEGGVTRTTDWVDATAAELSMLTHNLTPPRAGVQASGVASDFKGAFDSLSEEQQEVAALGFYEGHDWRDRLEDGLDAHGNQAAVEDYMAAERVATAYATQVAYAMWGENVDHIQFIASRQNVVPFGERNDPDAERPPVQSAPLGWRGLIEEPGQSRENFARTFRAAVEASGQ
ncbi:hypothetical protein GCM10023169_37720 [Georgenia halophila]|uniref:Uncharacterized protein n=1 Tax=Georgenia halophila TaxID=620889 RepID=A0ABP8LPS5_9MICO